MDLENAKTNIDLKEHVATSLAHHTSCFDKAVAWQSDACELLMWEYGETLPHEHVRIIRLAEVGILNFATMASIARANRTIRLKLPSAPLEHLLSDCISVRNRFLVKTLVVDMTQNSISSFEPVFQLAARYMLKPRAEPTIADIEDDPDRKAFDRVNQAKNFDELVRKLAAAHLLHRKT